MVQAQRNHPYQEVEVVLAFQEEEVGVVHHQVVEVVGELLQL